MRRLLGVIDLLLGLVLLGLGIFALSGIPGQFADRVREPEDFYGLIFLFVLTIFLASVTLWIGTLLFRRRGFSWQATPVLWVGGILTSVLLVGVAMLDLVGPNRPGTYGLRVLLIPAIALGLSHFPLRAKTADD